MSVQQEILRKDIGFRFHIAIDKELHVDSGTRTPDKITVHASLEGHTDTYDEALDSLKAAKMEILAEIKSLEPEKPQQETEAKTENETVIHGAKLYPAKAAGT